MLACKWRFSALPVLTYPNVRSAPVLENLHFRLSLSQCRLVLGGGAAPELEDAAIDAEQADKHQQHARDMDGQDDFTQ